MADEPEEPLIDPRPRPGVLVCVAVGGALGALARYGVGRVIQVQPHGFPRATFSINIAGAFVLGMFLTFVHERPWPARYVRPLFAVGFLGAFTTFSTLAVETVTLVKDGDAGLGIRYLYSSVVLGLAICALGVRLGRAAARSRAGGAA